LFGVLKALRKRFSPAKSVYELPDRHLCGERPSKNVSSESLNAVCPGGSKLRAV
jgi:hypothetical protein